LDDRKGIHLYKKSPPAIPKFFGRLYDGLSLTWSNLGGNRLVEQKPVTVVV